MKIRRFHWMNEVEWMNNVRRNPSLEPPNNKSGEFCRYEDVKPLLERIKELEQRQCDCADWVDNVDNAVLDVINLLDSEE